MNGILRIPHLARVNRLTRRFGAFAGIPATIAGVSGAPTIFKGFRAAPPRPLKTAGVVDRLCAGRKNPGVVIVQKQGWENA